VADNDLPLATPDLEALAEAIARHLASRLRGDDRRLLDRGQLAGRLGIGERTVGALVGRQELPPPLRVGGCVRWDWHQVLNFLVARRPRQPRRRRGVYDRHAKGG
jgi:hypothetical protein